MASRFDIRQRHSAFDQPARKLDRHTTNLAPLKPGKSTAAFARSLAPLLRELENDLGGADEAELVASGALNGCRVGFDASHLGAERGDLTT